MVPRAHKPILPLPRRQRDLASVLIATCGALAAACGTVPIEILPDARDAGEPDVATDVTIDINQDILNSGGETAIAKDIDPNAKELCDNNIDDNGDGRVDENCWPAPNLRPDEKWFDFGTVVISGAKGPAPTLTFAAPTKNQGMVLVARDITAGQKAYVWAEQLRTPSGLQEIGLGANWAEKSPNRAGPQVAGATALIGESAEVTVAEGVWEFGFVRADLPPWKYLGTPQKGALQLGLLSRPDVAQQPLVLDLDVYLVGGTTGMSPEAFGKSPQWQQMRSKVEALWNGKSDPGALGIGITLGDVQFFALEGDGAKEFKYIDNVLSGGADNELPKVYGLTGAMRPTSTAATLVLVSGLYDKGVGVYVGLSQLAGVNGMASSRFSGMAVVIDEKDWAVALAEGASGTTAGDVFGVILAHEIGHFLGLWHTDEADGTLHDPVADTGECQVAAPVLTPDLCLVQARNLMFWQPDNQGKPLKITGDQRIVVRHSPALHPKP